MFLWLPTGYGKSVCYISSTAISYVNLDCTALPPRKQSVCLVFSILLDGGPSNEVSVANVGHCHSVVGVKLLAVLSVLRVLSFNLTDFSPQR